MLTSVDIVGHLAAGLWILDIFIHRPLYTEVMTHEVYRGL